MNDHVMSEKKYKKKKEIEVFTVTRVQSVTSGSFSLEKQVTIKFA